jgi:hypothetical protein
VTMLSPSGVHWLSHSKVANRLMMLGQLGLTTPP